MVTAEVANQKDEYARIFGTLSQQREGALSVTLLAVFHTGDVKDLFNGPAQGLSTVSEVRRPDEGQRLYVVIFFKNGPHKTVSCAQITQQRVDISVRFNGSLCDDGSEVFSAITFARRSRQVEREK